MFLHSEIIFPLKFSSEKTRLIYLRKEKTMWKFNSDKPVYLQIVDEIKARIISGEYKAGERIPSVRELAEEAKVNPNTMQKALSETERQGLVFSMRTSGKYITNDEQKIASLKYNTVRKECEIFINKINKLGFSPDEIFEIIQDITKNR